MLKPEEKLELLDVSLKTFVEIQLDFYVNPKFILVIELDSKHQVIGGHLVLF